jgi:surface carbohydrate biosynthesis protein
LGGKSPEEFAKLVAKSGGASLVDIYCVWGEEQYKAIIKQKLVHKENLRLTGCPRYDYCSYPWRNSLPSPNVASDYVLINTNFPVTNSRFSRNSNDEITTMVNAGFEYDFAKIFVHDAHTAHFGMIELINRLVAIFPEKYFVLRPHPFESSLPYEQAINGKNFEVRQEGTSIEWLNCAKVLIQLNCLTAIEAAAFGVPSLSPAWLNTPSLNVPLSSNLSINFDSEQSLIEHLQELKNIYNNSNKITFVDDVLLSDGKASQRVAQTIIDELAMRIKPKIILQKLPLSFRILNILRFTVGYSLFSYLQNKLKNSTAHTRKQSKLFSAQQISNIIKRIDDCTGKNSNIKVSLMEECKLKSNRLASRNSICISITTP